MSALRMASQQAVGLLLAFAEHLPAAYEPAQAWAEFWAKAEPTPQAQDAHSDIFSSWYLYLRVPEAVESDEFDGPPSEHTVVAKFIQENLAVAEPSMVAYLQAARSEPLSFWQVDRVEQGVGVGLRDLATGRECFTHDVACSRSTHRWDLLFAHVVGVDGAHVIAAAAPFVLPAARFRERVQTALDLWLAGGLRSKSVIQTLDASFRGLYQSFLDELLHPVTPQIRNTSGEKLLFTRTVYLFAPDAREQVRSRLLSMSNLEYEGEKEGLARFLWTVSQKRGKTMAGAARASLVLGTDRLSIECNSRQRDGVMRKRVEKAAGSLLHHESTTSEPLEKLIAQSSPTKSALLDLSTLPPPERDEILRVMEERYLAWADDRIPALNGQTPREAIRQPQWRQAVVDLVNDWQNLQASMPNPQFQFDFNKLRRTLGLPEE